MGNTIDRILKVLEEHPGVNSRETELLCCDLIEKWADEGLGLNEDAQWKNLLCHVKLFRKDWVRCISVLDSTYKRLDKGLFSCKVDWDYNLLNTGGGNS